MIATRAPYCSWPMFQALGLWSYSIYMIHAFVFQVMKTGASFLENRTGLDLVGWHNAEKLVLIGSPGAALVPALVLCGVLVVPLAALSYRWIERPAMDRFGARRFRSRAARIPSLADAVETLSPPPLEPGRKAA